MTTAPCRPGREIKTTINTADLRNGINSPKVNNRGRGGILRPVAFNRLAMVRPDDIHLPPFALVKKVHQRRLLDPSRLQVPPDAVKAVAGGTEQLLGLLGRTFKAQHFTAEDHLRKGSRVTHYYHAAITMQSPLVVELAGAEASNSNGTAVAFSLPQVRALTEATPLAVNIPPTTAIKGTLKSSGGLRRFLAEAGLSSILVREESGIRQFSWLDGDFSGILGEFTPTDETCGLLLLHLVNTYDRNRDCWLYRDAEKPGQSWGR